MLAGEAEPGESGPPGPTGATGATGAAGTGGDGSMMPEDPIDPEPPIMLPPQQVSHVAASTQAFGDAATTGLSDIAARADHKHGLPSGTGAGTGHNILSASHLDSLAASVVDGDLMIGNVTPAWSRLPITVPAANILEVPGVVNGELRPSWKAIHDGTAPVTQAFGDVAAAGTALTAAHRDHKHGMPSGASAGGFSAVWSYITGRYYSQPTGQFTPTTQAVVTGFIRCFTFYLQSTTSFDQIAAEITTGTTGSIHLGVWGPFTTPYGNVSLLFDSGDISVSAPAVKTAALTAFSLSPGWYLLGQENSTNHTMRAFTAGALPSIPFTTFGGTGRARSYLFVAHTYGALPSPISGLADTGDTDLMPLISLRVA